MSTDFNEKLDDVLSKPKAVSVEGESATFQTVDDVIKAANFKAQRTGKGRRLGFIKRNSPGATR